MEYPQVKVDEAVSECWNSSGGTDAARKIGLLTWKGLDSSSDNGKIRSYKDLFKCSSKGKSSEVLGDLPTVMEER